MPEKIGHYTVVSELGRGGMGIVYKAHEESLNRFVAIKVLTERLTDDSTFLQRFVREAQAAAGVSHPNIVQIFFIGEDQGHPYFVMEYVSGRSLNQIRRQEGRIGNPRAAQMILQAAHGLAAAHEKGIIHRDIKPANLILDDRGMVKIADFGLALPVDAETRFTGTGMLVGTPGYLAPEQCRGEMVDQRTDIYALGVTFYELLAGIPPFRGESPLALLRQILDEEPPDISTLNPDVDAETRRILSKMIAKERADRYQNCHEVVADLEEYLAGQGVRSMTAGLATRMPSAALDAAAAATAMAGAQAPTGSGASKAATLASAAHDIPTVVVPSGESPAAAANAGPRTLPETPMRGADTEVPHKATVAAPTAGPSPVAAVAPAAPNMLPPVVVPPVMGAQPPSVPPARRSRSSATLVVILLAVLLVTGGLVAAGLYGAKMYRDWKSGRPDALTASAGTTDTAVSTGLTSTAGQQTNSAATTSNPPPGVLLANGINTAATGVNGTAAPGSGSGTPATSSVSAGQPSATAPLSSGQSGASSASPSLSSSPSSLSSSPSSNGQQQAALQNHGSVPATASGSRQTSQQPVARPGDRPAQGGVRTIYVATDHHSAGEEQRAGGRARSGVGIAVTGDQGLVGAVSSALASELGAAGLEVTDTQTLPSTEDMVRSGNVSAARLIDRLRGEGLAVLLLARVDPTGQRELNYLGHQDTAYSARITLTTYDLATGKPFGTSRSATIEYTSRSAERESEKVVGPLARSSAEAIQSH